MVQPCTVLCGAFLFKTDFRCLSVGTGNGDGFSGIAGFSPRQVAFY